MNAITPSGAGHTGAAGHPPSAAAARHHTAAQPAGGTGVGPAAQRAGRPRWSSWPRPARDGAASWRLSAAGFASLLAVWLALSQALGPQLAPGPYVVGAAMWSDIRAGVLPYHLGITLGRVLLTTALALAAGGAAGVWMGLSRPADAFWAPWLVTGLTIPRLLLAVAAYLILGLNEAALVAATAIAVAPSVAVALREGIRAVDWKLVDMARAFAVPEPRRWRRVIWPQLLPFAAASARGALSLSWKMVLFAELLGRPSGIGYQIAFYFQTFNMRQILAYGTAAVIVAAVLETGMRALEQHLYRWRPSAAV
ncbi:MAG TPA: ABC transporter permease subunit [bacterium]|nr:ABC transporter permease subunit [bacterium]